MAANDKQLSNVLITHELTQIEARKRSSARSFSGFSVVVADSVDRGALPSDDELFDLFTKSSTTTEFSDDEKRLLELINGGKIVFELESPDELDEEPIRTTSQEALGFRWPDLAVRRQFSGTHYSKYAVLNQEMHLLFAMGASSPQWFHETAIDDSFPNVYQEQAKWVQFALGVGYSEIIDSVQEVDIEGDNYRAKVSIDWWSRLTGSGVLLIDQDFVVREAELSVGSLEISARTQGLYESKDAGRHFACASLGTFRKSRSGNSELDFSTRLKGLKFGMSDAEFSELADMETPAHLARFEIGPEGGIDQVRKASIESISRPWARYLMLLNLVLVLGYGLYKIVVKRNEIRKPKGDVR
jgi:hypothetical protein